MALKLKQSVDNVSSNQIIVFTSSFFSRISLNIFFLSNSILGFHTIPRDTKDNRHRGLAGVSNKRNNQNAFVKSTQTWPP